MVKAISPGLIHLVKCHSLFNPRSSVVTQSTLLLEGVDLLDKKCNNRHLRRIFQFKKNISSRGKFYWMSLFDDIYWKRSWLLPGKYCISNKVKETHFKILHKIYPVNFNVSKYLYIDSSCSFCKQAEETVVHLFFDCPLSKQFWSDLGSHIFDSANIVHSFSLKDIILKITPWNILLFFFILYGKFFIHKQKFANSYPSYPLFKIELNSLLKSLHLIKKKNPLRFLKYYTEVFKGNPCI